MEDRRLSLRDAFGHVRPPRSISEKRSLAREQRARVDLKLGVDIRGSPELRLLSKRVSLIADPKNHKEEILWLMRNSKTTR